MDFATEIAWLSQVGPRTTGSPAHSKLVDRIEESLRDLGLDPKSDTLSFERWQSPDLSEVILDYGDTRLPVASVFPYSGTTGPDGIAAEAVILDMNEPQWSAAEGKIAVIAVRNPSVDLSAFVGTWFNAPEWGHVNNPQVGAQIAAALLPAAKDHGVAAVIFAWQSIPKGLARQYMPFTMAPQHIPVIFVDGQTTDTLLSGAAHSIHITLTMTIDPETKTRTIWTSVEGTSRPEETIILVTHTDGVNPLEENGHIALLEIAKRVAEHPCHRSVVFAFVTGHLRIPAVTGHGQASSRWLDDHPEIWDGAPGHYTAVAGLGCEHFGARANPESTDEPTTLQPELLYASTPELAEIADREWDFLNIHRVSRPLPAIHFGEAEPMYQRSIPTIALVTAPDYLLAEHAEHAVDIEAMRRQIESFHRLLHILDDIPKPDLGIVESTAHLTQNDITQSVLKALTSATEDTSPL